MTRHQPRLSTLVLCAGLFAGAVGSAAAQSASQAAPAAGAKTAVPAADKDFAQKAAVGGMAEVQLGKLAQQKASNDQVKQFGSHMVEDHSKANDELKQIASAKGLALPTDLDASHKSKVAKMEKLSGAEFDRAYSKMMLSDHKKDVSEFEKQSTKGTDPDLKAFASKTLPTLKEHLQMASALPANQSGGKMNSNKNSNSNSNRP